MKKKLPNVFVNKQDKKINNNKEVYYSKANEVFNKNKNTRLFLDELMVRKKIDEIFSSTKFVYKIKVLILTDEGEFKETLIAKINNDLVTLNNKKIKITDIRDIKIL